MKNILILIVLIFIFSDLYSQTTLNSDLFISGRDSLPTNGEYVTGKFLFFDQQSGAFRGGFIEDSENWSPDSLGFASFGFGESVKATGSQSVALGSSTKATGNIGATAIGYNSQASGDRGSTAIGYNTAASGNEGATALGFSTKADGDNGSTALGYGTKSSGNSCTVVGMYNDTIVARGTVVTNMSPIFIVGNGDADSISNALVITKNGKVGIGVNTPLAAINHKNGAKLTVSGIWTDASDVTKKYNIKPLLHGLKTILALDPVSYNYLSDDSHSLGFVAQELEKVLPEMVYGEDGDKSIGYGQITAVLTKAVQEQQVKIQQQDDAISDLHKELQQLKNLIFSFRKMPPSTKSEK